MTDVKFDNALNDDVLAELVDDLKDAHIDEPDADEFLEAMEENHCEDFVYNADSAKAVNGFKSANTYDGMFGVLDMIKNTLGDLNSIDVTNPAQVANEAYRERYDEFMHALEEKAGVKEDQKLDMKTIAKLVKAAKAIGYEDLDF